MNKVSVIIRSLLSVVWLLFCIIVFVKLFFNITNSGVMLDNKLKFEQNSFFDGGNSIKTLNDGEYITTIHEPLYQGYPFRNRYGYMHIEWSWEDNAPEYIAGKYDLDGDGSYDIRLELSLEDKSVKWESFNDKVKGPLVTNSILTFLRVGTSEDITVYNLDNSRAVKIMIEKGFADSYYNKDYYFR